MDPATLAATAIAFIAAEMSKGALSGAGAAAAKKIFEYLKDRLTGGTEAAALAELEQAPGDEGNRETLEFLVGRKLAKDDDFQAGLAAVLDEARAAGALVQSVEQNAHVTGDNNIVVQVAGKGNVTNVGGKGNR